MKTVALSFVALTCSCTNAFTVAPSIRTSRAPVRARGVSCVMMANPLKEEDFVPSERWLGEYMGQQGLRYALNKTPKEIETEGDYSLFERLFGQTSNNKARMDLKSQILKKVNIPTDPKQYKEWTAKYGYGRFFPTYVDKSGYSNDEAPAPQVKEEPKRIVAAAPTPKLKASGSSGGAKPSGLRVSVKPKVSVPKVQPKKSAPPKVQVKPTPVAPKPKGNIKNIPKAL